LAAGLTFLVTGVVAILVAWLMTLLVERPSLRIATWAGAALDGAWHRIRPWQDNRPRPASLPPSIA
jgi:peptidoglycan/LPS O-acetylase OafA/YrhL